MGNWAKGSNWAKLVLGRLRGAVTSGGSGFYVCDASGFWGTPGDGVLGDLGHCI